MFNKQPIKLTALADIAGYPLARQVDFRQSNAGISENIYPLRAGARRLVECP
jgi:hypothetical protein